MSDKTDLVDLKLQGCLSATRPPASVLRARGGDRSLDRTSGLESGQISRALEPEASRSATEPPRASGDDEDFQNVRNGTLNSGVSDEPRR